jgi:hypothetical protein
MDPNTGKIGEGAMAAQTQQRFNTVFGVWQAAGLEPEGYVFLDFVLFVCFCYELYPGAH